MSILTEAERIVHGSRQAAYGHPLDNHTATAQMWSAYISRRIGLLIDLTAEDVCLLNILQKVSRAAQRHTDDNLVDIAGYAACIELVRAEAAVREKLSEGGS